jgi:3-methyl-2-oxobutanoate hydroxymethyltransferase
VTEADRRVPTIGIGASAGCDGQVLVVNDMLGMFDWTPKFVRRYADLKHRDRPRRGRIRP